MLQNQTLEQLQDLRLTGMATALEQQQDSPTHQSLSFDERLGMLVDAEAHERSQRKELRLLKASKLKASNACLEDVHYGCLLYTSPSPRDQRGSRMPSSA